MIVITGATSGIGYALAGQALAQGMSVIGVGRSASLCVQAEERFHEQFPHVQCRYCVADLALQSEIRDLAAEIGQTLETWGSPGLNVLVNNAATVTFWRRETSEGFETQWAVNHLAAFMLSLLLLPLLQRSPQAKIITVSSGSHRNVDMRWDDLQRARGYNPLAAYKQSKLANILFTFEFNRRLGSGSTVHAFAVNPGLVKTDIGMKTGMGLAGIFWALWRRKGISPAESAQGLMRLIQDPAAHQAASIYWKHGLPLEPDPRALDPEASRRLWDISAEMCQMDLT